MLEALESIERDVRQIKNALMGSSRIQRRLDEIERSIYGGAGTKLIIGSAAIANKLMSTGYVSGSAGWLINKSGNVEFNDGLFRGTIYAAAGAFTDKVYVGTDADRIVIDGANKTIGSENYSAGLRGWQIDGEGNAEFANGFFRGSIEGLSFKLNEIIAQGGTQLVVHGAGTLYDDCSIHASDPFAVNISASAAGTPSTMGNVGDILRIKTHGYDTWLYISSLRYDVEYTEYTCYYHSGSVTTYKAGLPVLNYGVSGEGGIEISADHTNAPFIRVLTHSGSPWSSLSEQARLGNLDGWGAFSGEQYGIALGDYSTGTYLYYNSSLTPSFKLSGGGGNVTLDEDGLTLVGGAEDSNSILWLGGTENYLGRIQVIEAATASGQYTVGNYGDIDGVLTFSALSKDGIFEQSVLRLDANGTAIATLTVYDNATDYYGWFYYADQTRVYSGTLSDYVFDLTDDGLLLRYGTRINEFSNDVTLADKSGNACPTERAVENFVTHIPAWHFRLSAQQTITTSTVTEVQWDTTIYNLEGGTLSNYKYYAPVSGYYWIASTVLWNNVVPSAIYYMAINTNGYNRVIAQDIVGASAGAQLSQSAAMMMYMASGTYARVRVWQNSGSNVNIYHGVYSVFSGHLIRRV